MSCKHLLLGVSCLTLGACNTWNSHIGDEDPYLGEAVRYNAAIQTINPDPVYSANNAQPGSNGERGAQAVKRYRTDRVKQPAKSSGGSMGGSGSSGGSGLSGANGPG